jgi:hypothetical protein
MNDHRVGNPTVGAPSLGVVGQSKPEEKKKDHAAPELKEEKAEKTDKKA